MNSANSALCLAVHVATIRLGREPGRAGLTSVNCLLYRASFAWMHFSQPSNEAIASTASLNISVRPQVGARWRAKCQRHCRVTRGPELILCLPDRRQRHVMRFVTNTMFFLLWIMISSFVFRNAFVKRIAFKTTSQIVIPLWDLHKTYWTK